MAKYGPDDLYALIGGRDLSQFITEISAEITGVNEQSNTIGDAWVENSHVGVAAGSATVNGYYDDATDATNDALVEAQGTTPVLIFGLAGNTQGRDFVGFEGAMAANISRSGDREGLMKMSATFAADGAVEDGEVIQSLAAESGDGATSDGSEDNGASSASGGSGYVSVSALTLGGYTSVTVKIQDSANDSTWADLITFTNITTAPTAERVTVSGTIDRYVRAELTWNGSGSGESVTVFVGLKRS